MNLTSRFKAAGPGIALGAVSALAILAIFAIAGTLMTMQCGANCGTIEVAEIVAVAEPAPEPERLPASQLPPTPVPVLEIAEQREALIDGTFDLLVKEIIVAPAPSAPESEPVIAAAEPDAPSLPMSRNEAQRLASAVPNTGAVGSNAASEAATRVASEPDTDAAATSAYASPEVASELSVAPGETKVGDSPVNVRAGPSTSEQRLFVFAAGTVVSASARRSGWVKLADAGGREGWVDASYVDNLDLTTLPEADIEVKQTAAPEAAAPDTGAVPSVAPDASPVTPASGSVDRRTVGGTGVNVRSGPSNGNARLFALPAGTPVIVTGSDKRWLRIIDAKGRTGWAYSEFLSSAAQ